MKKQYFQNAIINGDFKVIGNGSFGKVILVKHLQNKKFYAIKIVSLLYQMNLKQCQQNEIKIIHRQIQIHSSLNHQNIVKLLFTYIDNLIIHMVMQYAENGNLFYYQNTKYRFIEKQAHRFFYQSCKSIDYLHKKDILHRDLKVILIQQPQNILLDKNYNVKLCDFGWSAYDIYQQRKTFCGTYQYMAPEMILKKNYDYRVDIWSLGILLYQLVHGKAPFKGTDLKQISKNISHGQYQLGEWLSDEIKNLIKSLLKLNPDKRILMDQIFKHSWITKYNIYDISKRIQSQPALINSFSYQYFKNRKKQAKKHKQLLSFSQKNLATICKIKQGKIFEPKKKTSFKKFNIKLKTISLQKMKLLNKGIVKSLNRFKSEVNLQKKKKKEGKNNMGVYQSYVRVNTNPNNSKLMKKNKLYKKNFGLF